MGFGLFSRRGGYSHNPSASDVVAHYTRRRQPDHGGARNFSFDNLRLPYTSPIGAGVMVNYTTRPRPIGNTPMFYAQTIGITPVADNATGQMFSQPLIDPNSPSPSGIDKPIMGM